MSLPNNQKHKANSDDVRVWLGVSDTEPGHIVLGMTAGGISITTQMDPQKWAEFFEAAAKVAFQAHDALAAIALAEARKQPDCH